MNLIQQRQSWSTTSISIYNNDNKSVFYLSAHAPKSIYWCCIYRKNKKNNDCWVFSSVNGTFILQVNRQKILYILYGQFFSYFFFVFWTPKQTTTTCPTHIRQSIRMANYKLPSWVFFGSVARPVQWKKKNFFWLPLFRNGGSNIPGQIRQ